MTDPKYAGVVIIIAGYQADIASMLDTNPGLKSRFQHFLEFPDWGPDDCVSAFTKKASHGGYVMEPGIVSSLEWGFTKLTCLKGWGNARDVQLVWKATLQNRADRVVGQPTSPEKRLLELDVRDALQTLIRARESSFGRDLVPRSQEANSHAFADAGGSSSGPPPVTRDEHGPEVGICRECEEEALPVDHAEAINEVTKDASKEAARDEAEGNEPPGVSVDCTRDDGVSDEVWAELEAAKEEERRREEELIAEQLKAEEERKRIEAEMLAAYEAEQARIRVLQEEQQRQEAARRAQEAYEAKLAAERRKCEEEEHRRREEAARRKREEQRIKEKLRQISPCPAGFNWHRMGGGWRCGGGSHFVSDAELRKSFSV